MDITLYCVIGLFLIFKGLIILTNGTISQVVRSHEMGSIKVYTLSLVEEILCSDERRADSGSVYGETALEESIER